MKHERYNRLYTENIESQRHLEMLADLIIEESVKRSIPILKKRVLEDEEDYLKQGDEYTLDAFKYGIYPIFLPVLIKSLYSASKLKKELKGFIKTIGNLRVEFFERGNRSTTRGDYGHNNISIYLPVDTYEDAEGILIEAYATENFPLERESYQLIKLLSTEKDVIIHELQHYYDDWRSKGNYRSPNYSNDSDSDIYWGSSEEVSARYTQTVSILKKDGTIYKDWDTVLSMFKHKFRKWEIIDKDSQKRLVSRLSQEYLEVNKQTEEPLLDISNQVKKLQARFNIDEIELRYSPKEYIEIQRLNTGDIRKDEQALKEIIKLADTYRHMIITYMEKGWFTDVKNSTMLLKKYGFNPNAGRNTNYKYKTGKSNFTRYSARK